MRVTWVWCGSVVHQRNCLMQTRKTCRADVRHNNIIIYERHLQKRRIWRVGPRRSESGWPRRRCVEHCIIIQVSCMIRRVVLNGIIRLETKRLASYLGRGPISRRPSESESRSRSLSSSSSLSSPLPSSLGRGVGRSAASGPRAVGRTGGAVGTGKRAGTHARHGGPSVTRHRIVVLHHSAPATGWLSFASPPLPLYRATVDVAQPHRAAQIDFPAHSHSFRARRPDGQTPRHSARPHPPTPPRRCLNPFAVTGIHVCALNGSSCDTLPGSHARKIGEYSDRFHVLYGSLPRARPPDESVRRKVNCCSACTPPPPNELVSAICTLAKERPDRCWRKRRWY